MNMSIFYMIMVTFLFVVIMINILMNSFTYSTKTSLSLSLFSSVSSSAIIFNVLFFALGMSNLISLVCFSYPLTTTLAFNFSLAFMMWLFSVLFQFSKKDPFSSFIPNNAPWYLVPFLGVIEVVSVTVRPVTLCLRLLANMSAGHILLSLICKMPYETWLLGSLFGMLELMVSMVQSFVFMMLISVYLEESFSH